MTPEQWLEAHFDTQQQPKALTIGRVQKLVTLATRDSYRGVAFVQALASDAGQEAVVLDIEISLGQKQLVNDIRRNERIAIMFSQNDELPPSVLPLRTDFPVVPHLNASPRNVPRSLCVYEELWSEVKLQWTPLQYLERIRHWFEKAAYGELHAMDQPLDPFFLGGSLFTLIVPPAMLTLDYEGEIYVSRVVNANGSELFFLEDAQKHRAVDRNKTAAVLRITTNPRTHGRLHYAPTSLQELTEVDTLFGQQIADAVRTDIRHWAELGSALLNLPLLILVNIPLQREGDTEPESQSSRAFMTSATAGEIGAAMGVVEALPGSTGSCCWGLLLARPKLVDLSGIQIQTGDVRLGFSPELAAESSGTIATQTKVVLIGAGALGSQLAMTLCREGFGCWTIIDKDVLLPHNLARHELHGSMLGHTKATALTWLIQQLHNSADVAKSIVCDVLSPGDQQDTLRDALAEADVIIDASASVAVARWLAHNTDRDCPAFSVFFNPEGCDLVTLYEGCQRSSRLDYVEMDYYRALSTHPDLSRHLAPPTATLLHSTSCREPSVQIPQSRIMRLIGRAADTIRQSMDEPDSIVTIWHDSRDAQTLSHHHVVPTFSATMVDEWRLICSPELLQSLIDYRCNSPRVETGGVIAGVWDREHKSIYVTNAIGPPEDSVQEHHGFIRGTKGLQESLETLSIRSAGNIRYIGEWHTHPQRHTSRLSTADHAFLHVMKSKTSLEDSPAIMLVIGDDGIRLALLDSDNRAIQDLIIDGFSLNNSR